LAASVEGRPWPLLLAILVVAGAAWLYLGRNASFAGDQWDFAYGRRGDDLDTWLRPHNEHLSLALVGYYRAMWATVGLEDYWPYVLANVVVHSAVVVLVFALFRRRAGTAVALAAATVLAFVGRGEESILWDFQMGFLLSGAAGTAAFVAIGKPGRRRSFAAGLLIALSIAAVSWGVVFAGGVFLALALRREWRRLAVPLVPLALYGAWALHYRPARLEPDNVVRAPKFAADAFANTLASLAGLSFWWGRVLALVVVLSLVAWLVRVRRPSPMQLAALALPVAAWVMTALARADIESPTAARYVWPYAVLVLVAAAYVVPPVRVGPRGAAVLLVLTAGAVVSNVDATRRWNAGQVEARHSRLAQLGAMDLARPVVSPEYVLGPVSWFGHFRPELYFAATDAYGRPGYDEPQLKTLPPSVRAIADAALLSTAPPLAVPGARAAHVAPEVAGEPPTSRRCLRLDPDPRGRAREVVLPPTGAMVAAPAGTVVRVAFRRFGDTFQPRERRVEGHVGIVPRRDAGRTRWIAGLYGSAQFAVCGGP
jgi:hypothetical protein